MGEQILIRPIQATDDVRMAEIIRRVMPEFGADGPGFAIHDSEVDQMSVAYAQPRSAYFVVEIDGVVEGGAGIAPLAGLESDYCELRKMYFLPLARRRGLGRQMIAKCLQRAREFEFRQCYLETLTGMDAAQQLYQSCGFSAIAGALGATGHFGCNRFYLLKL